MRETWVQSLGWEDFLEKEWQPVLLPGKSHGQRCLEEYSSWGRRESDVTEQLHFTSRALAATEPQGHLPSASGETEPPGATAVELQHSLREFRVDRGILCSREPGGTGL